MSALTLATQVFRHDHLRPYTPLVFVLVVPMAKLLGLYHRDESLLRKSTLDEGPAIVGLATACTFVIWMVAPYMMLRHRTDRPQILFLWASMILLLVCVRALTRLVFTRRAMPERCMVVGDPSVCDQIRRKLDGSRGISAEIAFALSFDSPADEALEMAALAHSDGLRRLAAEQRLQRLIIAPHNSDADHIRGLVQAANVVGLRVSIVPRMLEVIGSSVQFDDVNGVTVLGVKKFGLSRSSLAMKRALDVVGALAGLMVLSPLMALTAVVIKLDTPGPVLFRQRRIGQDGRAFVMLKFRTMRDGTDDLRTALAHLNEADGLFKIARDPRITRVGRLLRPLSLDEVPQLVNVLWGQMSLVGPRPLVVNEDERVEGHYRERLALTPGITGRWQILGSSRVPLAEMVKLDYLYVANWSLWNDMKILLRTVPYVLARRGM